MDCFKTIKKPSFTEGFLMDLVSLDCGYGFLVFPDLDGYG
jgi:hypothetical protein